MFPSTQVDATNDAGFTLIEALAALAVVTASLAAIGQLANSNLRAGLHTERHLAGVATMRKLIAGLPPRDALPFGSVNGALEGDPWRIDAAPIPGSTAPRGAGWLPQQIVVSIQSPSGGMIDVNMVRLRKLAPK